MGFGFDLHCTIHTPDLNESLLMASLLGSLSALHRHSQLAPYIIKYVVFSRLEDFRETTERQFPGKIRYPETAATAETEGRPAQR